MEINFKRRGENDCLADSLDRLLSSKSEEDFYYQISLMRRGGTGKDYKNREGFLPLGGRYREFEINGSKDSRRIVIDMDRLEIHSSRNHYKSMEYVGQVEF